MKFKPEHHIVGKVYDLTQENMNTLITVFEKLSDENSRLKEVLKSIGIGGCECCTEGSLSRDEMIDDARAVLGEKK